MVYQPNYWKILKITKGDRTVYKVLAHWFGDLQYHDTSWRLNSGITKVVFNKEFNLYEIYGKSGSVYHCLATNEHMSGYMIGLLEGFEYKLNSECSDIQIEVINVEDIKNEDWYCE